jgi:hypothetical protein
MMCDYLLPFSAHQDTCVKRAYTCSVGRMSISLMLIYLRFFRLLLVVALSIE